MSQEVSLFYLMRPSVIFERSQSKLKLLGYDNRPIIHFFQPDTSCSNMFLKIFFQWRHLDSITNFHISANCPTAYTCPCQWIRISNHCCYLWQLSKERSESSSEFSKVLYKKYFQTKPIEGSKSCPRWKLLLIRKLKKFPTLKIYSN